MNFSVIRATRSPSRTLSKQDVPVKDIPNLFHDYNVLNGLSDEEKIQKLSSMPNISVFMIVDLFCLIVFKSNIVREVLQNITRTLCRVPSRYFETLFYNQLPKTFLSEDDTACIVGTELTKKKLVTTSELYKFYFQHPAAPLCEKHTECGFMLKVTPCLKYGKQVNLIYNSSQRRVSIQLIFTVTVR